MKAFITAPYQIWYVKTFYHNNKRIHLDFRMESAEGLAKFEVVPVTKAAKTPALKDHIARISAIISKGTTFPDEDAADIAFLKEQVRADLKPESAYEEVLAENIIARMIEMMRISRWRDAALRQALKTVVHKDLSVPEDYNENENEDVSERRRIVDRVLYACESAKEMAALDEELWAYSTTVGDLQMRAYLSIKSDMDEFDVRLNIHRKGLRLMREDYDTVQASRMRRQRNREAEDVSS